VTTAQAQNTVIGTTIEGHKTFSATSQPGQSGTVIGGQSSVTACPDRNGQTPNVVGTYVPPGGSVTATASGNGGGGTIIGYQSTVTVGGPGCR